jgi:hypothetical protein
MKKVSALVYLYVEKKFVLALSMKNIYIIEKNFSFDFVLYFEEFFKETIYIYAD